MIPTDDLVYAADDGTSYLAHFEPLGWVSWPAERGGWAQRRTASEDDADPDRQLPLRLAYLALRLSGVSDGSSAG